jgi:hypothetical protein
MQLSKDQYAKSNMSELEKETDALRQQERKQKQIIDQLKSDITSRD